MVNIPVDEGYAYDVLAICYVKKNKKINNSEKNFNLINDCLKTQLIELHDIIISSQEYLNLINANLKTFDAVEKARYSSISAKEVDDLNMLRYQYKIELQKKFFPNSTALENKS